MNIADLLSRLEDKATTVACALEGLNEDNVVKPRLYQVERARALAEELRKEIKAAYVEAVRELAR